MIKLSPIKVFGIVGMIVFLLALIIPSLIKTREANSCLSCVNDLRQISAAKEQAGLEAKWEPSTNCDDPEIRSIVNQYIKNGDKNCPFGGTISYGLLGEDPICSLGLIETNSDHRLLIICDAVLLQIEAAKETAFVQGLIDIRADCNTPENRKIVNSLIKPKPLCIAGGAYHYGSKLLITSCSKGSQYVRCNIPDAEGLRSAASPPISDFGNEAITDWQFERDGQAPVKKEASPATDPENLIHSNRWTGKLSLYVKSSIKNQDTSYLNGQKHGKTTYWNGDGTLGGYETFLNGERHGQTIIMHKGETNMVVSWEKGKRHGPYRSWSSFNGVPYEQGQFVDGKKVGRWQKWDTNGAVLLDEVCGKVSNPRATKILQGIGMQYTGRIETVCREKMEPPPPVGIAMGFDDHAEYDTENNRWFLRILYIKDIDSKVSIDEFGNSPKLIVDSANIDSPWQYELPITLGAMTRAGERRSTHTSNRCLVDDGGK